MLYFFFRFFSCTLHFYCSQQLTMLFPRARQIHKLTYCQVLVTTWSPGIYVELRHNSSEWSSLYQHNPSNGESPWIPPHPPCNANENIKTIIIDGARVRSCQECERQEQKWKFIVIRTSLIEIWHCARGFFVCLARHVWWTRVPSSRLARPHRCERIVMVIFGNMHKCQTGGRERERAPEILRSSVGGMTWYRR